MKTPGLPLILLAAISMVSMYCNHHEKMIRDTKKFFAEQEKIEISPSTIEALGRLKSLIFDNIDNLIPLEEIESGLVRLDTLAEGIVYRISVSPNLGMLD